MRDVEKSRGLFQDDESFNLDAMSGIFEVLSQTNKRYKVSFIMFVSKEDPSLLFKKWMPDNFFISEKIYSDFIQIELKRVIKRKDIEGGIREISGSFAIYQFKKTNIWIALTNDKPDFFENGVVRYLERYRPDISRIYLTSKELNNVFENIGRNIESEIFVKKAVLYSHIDESQITFEKVPFQELFNNAENENRYVDKIEFNIQKNKKQIFHGFVSRSGILYFYSGKINYLFDNIIPLLVDKGMDKTKVFTHKERTFGTIEINPIDIIYSKNIFHSKEANLKFINALEKISMGSISVYHKNPYLHLSFLDYIDGSSFDIIATERDKMSIIPNFNCSIYSLMRICEQISKYFYEGIISSPEEPKYSLSDFLSD